MAKYIILAAAGMGWPGPRGMVRPGEEIILKDSTVPSRLCMAPLDQAAFDALKKAKEEYVATVEERLAAEDPPQKLNAKRKRELLHVPPIPVEEAEKPLDADDEDEGETLAEVGRKLEAGVPGGKLEPAAPAKGHAAGHAGGKRLADS